MSVVERALKRLQSQGTPRSVKAQRQIARVTPRRRDAGKPIVPAGEDQFVAGGHLVEFDIQSLAEAGLYAFGNNQLADQYRMIKQPILRKAAETGEGAEPHKNLVMVTSALAGEGKTFTSVNLSLSLASEKDWKVLVVDVDCRNPQLSRLLGVEQEAGLLDYLKDPSIQLESLILPTNIDGLSVLPLGTPDNDATEYLASARMQELCDDLTNNAGGHIVLFDSSPLLLTSESAVLSTQIGQVVMVVQANQTQRQVVVDALEKLDADRSIGMVLNRADQAGDLLNYGSGYGYGYGYGSGQ